MTLEEVFLSKVRKSTGCWLWVGAKCSRGYGSFQLDGKWHSAHRTAQELYNGPIPMGYVVMHSCDNPSCVNPAHLSPGTHSSNMFDAVHKGRKPGKEKLSPDQVRAIRQSKDLPQGRLAKLYGVSNVTISALLAGNIYTDVL